MTAPARPFAAIILAAGKGTRMKSDLHKVLHPLAGRPMLEHLLAMVEGLGAARTVTIVGSGREQVEPVVAKHGGAVAVQEPQLGTAHAVLQAEQALADFDGDVVILYGDTPLVEAETVARMLDRLAAPDAPAIVVGAFRPADPLRYGRVITTGDGTIVKMVEHKDATAEERAVDLCNSGMMAARATDLWAFLAKVGNDNAAGEYYLPDAVTIATAERRRSVAVEIDPEEVAGVNSRVELAALEAVWQSRRRLKIMDGTATLVAPDTVFLSYDTEIGAGAIIEPYVVFGPGVSVGAGAHIKSFSHLQGATVGAEAEVGPYARLRPGAVIGATAKVGNFVEVKNATLGAGAKASHLTYLGDTDVGAEANIGAGTITCNYDGFFKYQTVIGAGAFIGSNSALVAPVTIGAGALVGAGSVITKDVPADALGLARAEQKLVAGWSKRFREKMLAKKKAK